VEKSLAAFKGAKTAYSSLRTKEGSWHQLFSAILTSIPVLEPCFSREAHEQKGVWNIGNESSSPFLLTHASDKVERSMDMPTVMT
jgi:hypothetical protein